MVMREARDTERCKILLVRVRDLQMAITRDILVLDDFMPLKLAQLVSKNKSCKHPDTIEWFHLGTCATLLRRA